MGSDQAPAVDAYALVSFDLDGTLVDTASEIVEACNRTLADFDVPARPAAAIVRGIGHGTRPLMMGQLAQVLLEEPSRGERMPFERVYERFCHHYADTAGTSGRPYAGAPQALARLREAGVHCVCVTNKEERFALRVLERTGLRDALSLVVGGDTLAVKKPHRQTLDHCLAHHQVPARRAGHVGDSSVDIETARAAGLAAWAVPYGYNAGEPIASSRPDRIFQSLDDMARELVEGRLQPRPDPAAQHAGAV